MAANRRVFLRHLGSLPMISGGVTLLSQPMTVAEAADPIFAAIERHRIARQTFNEVCTLTDEVEAEFEGRVITAADHEAYDKWNLEEERSFAALLLTDALSPETRRVKLEHIKKYIDELGCFEHAIANLVKEETANV